MIFIPLINKNVTELLQCHTCREMIITETYEFDSEYEQVYCNTECLIASFEHGLNKPWSY